MLILMSQLSQLLKARPRVLHCPEDRVNSSPGALGCHLRSGDPLTLPVWLK